MARVTTLARRYCKAGVVLVTGAHHDQVADALAETPVLTLYNKRWQEGMGTSLSAGAAAVSGTAQAVLVMLTDQPFIDEADLDHLVSAAKADPDSIAAGAYNNTLGVPAIFPRRYLDDLKQLHGDKGARNIILRQSAVSEVAMPNAEFDLDTPAALAEFKKIEAKMRR